MITKVSKIVRVIFLMKLMVMVTILVKYMAKIKI